MYKTIANNIESNQKHNKQPSKSYLLIQKLQNSNFYIHGKLCTEIQSPSNCAKINVNVTVMNVQNVHIQPIFCMLSRPIIYFLFLVQ